MSPRAAATPRGTFGHIEFEKKIPKKDIFKRPNVDMAKDLLPIMIEKAGTNSITEADMKQLQLLLNLADAEITKDEALIMEAREDLEKGATRLRQKRNEKPAITTRSTLKHAVPASEKDAFVRLKQEKEDWKEKTHLKQAKIVELEHALRNLNTEIKELESTNKSLRRDKSKAEADAKQKPLSKGDLKKLKELRALTEKLAKQKSAIADAKASMKRDRSNFEKDKKNLQRDRQLHAHDLHEHEKLMKKLKAQQRKLDSERHKFNLAKQNMEHDKVQLDQKKLRVAHSASVHSHMNADMHNLRSKLYETESRLKWALMRLKWQGKQTTKIIERMRYVPSWIDSEGWDKKDAEKYINQFVDSIKKDDHIEESKFREGEKLDESTLEKGDTTSGGDDSADLRNERILNAQLHDELERLHAEFAAYRDALSKNLNVLGKNEDVVVNNTHDMLKMFEEASIHSVMERNPRMKPKKLAETSNKQVKRVIMMINDKIDAAHEHEKEVEGSHEDGKLLDSVALKDSVKIALSETLLKVGKLMLTINKQALARQVGDGNVADLTAGLTVADKDEGEYAVKYTLLQKKYEKLRVVQSQQNDVIELLKRQLQEAHMRHAQIHKELEIVLKIFMKAQRAAAGDGGAGFSTRIDIMEEFTKDEETTRSQVAETLNVSPGNVVVNMHAGALGVTTAPKLFVGTAVMAAHLEAEDDGTIGMDGYPIG